MRKIPLVVLMAACLAMLSTGAHAYIGPGVGVSLLGALFGLFAVIGLAAWGLFRWMFRSIVAVGGRADSSVMRSAHPMGAAGHIDDARAEAGGPARSSGIGLRVIYLSLGLFFGAVFAYPQELIRSWIVAGAYIVHGFYDPVTAFHAEPARFPPGEAGVVTHDRAHAFSGLNLEVSATANEARLMDMQGRVLHRWRHETHAIARGWAAAGEPVSDLSGLRWRRVVALPDGGLLVVLENQRATPYGAGLMKLDWDSNVVWMAPRNYHHDVDIGPDGRIYTLYQEVVDTPARHAGWLGTPFLDEGIAILSPNGKEIARINLIEAFADTPFESFLLQAQPNESGDPLHMNTVSVVSQAEGARSAIAEPGQLLVSIREMDTVAIIDPGTQKVAWASAALWAKQHEPVLTSGDNLVVFDNLGPGDGTSRAIEWNTARGTAVWQWAGEPGMPLSSEKYGAVSLLPNGNRLVTESNGGRAIEVTQAGEVAWEWRSDRRFGDDGELVGRLMEVSRLPRDFFAGRDLRTTQVSEAAP